MSVPTSAPVISLSVSMPSARTTASTPARPKWRATAGSSLKASIASMSRSLTTR
jgi:hypothetical protein